MERIAAPGILAYKAGDCFANLVSLMNEIPAGRDINSTTLEAVLQECVVDLANSSLRNFANLDLGTKFCYDVLQTISVESSVIVLKSAEFLGMSEAG